VLYVEVGEWGWMGREEAKEDAKEAE